MNRKNMRDLLQEGIPEPPHELSTPPLSSVLRRAHRRRWTSGMVWVAAASTAVVGTAFVVHSITSMAAPDGLPAAGLCASYSTVLPSPSDLPSGQATPHPANAGSLSQIADAVNTLGEQSYSSSYAGVAMDTGLDRVFVWRKPSEDFDQAVLALPGSTKIEILCAPNSRRELLQVVERLKADESTWQAKGLTIHQIGPRHDGACVEVGTEDPERAAAELRAHYGDMPMCFIASGGWSPATR